MQYIAVDTECTGLNPWAGDRPYIVTMSTLNQREYLYHRWPVMPKTRKVAYDNHKVVIVNKIRDVLADKHIGKVFHNARFDIRMLEFAGFKIDGPVHDTLIMAHVASGGSELQYGLKHLGKKWLQIDDQDEAALHEAATKARRKAKKLGWKIAGGKNAIPADYWLAPKEMAKYYAQNDSYRTILLFHLLWKELREDSRLWDIYKAELELWPIIYEMENRGLRIHSDSIEVLRHEYDREMSKQLAKIYLHAGEINVRSPRQLIPYFYKKKGYTPVRTAKGNLSLGKDVIHDFALQGDPVAIALQEYRTANICVNTFLDVYDRMKVLSRSKTYWVLHSNIRQVGPITGRMASSDPNLMNVGSEDSGRTYSEIKNRARECFGPRPGYVWLLPDYSQMEVWLFAFLSGEQRMIDILNSGKDFHGALAEQLWGSEPDFGAEAKMYRKRAKNILFMKLYGGGVGKAAKMLGCSYDEARSFVERFDRELPEALRFMRRMTNEARRNGFIRNPFGRKYHFPNSDFAYAATNYIIQGTGADILKRSLVRIRSLLWRLVVTGSILLPVHDEIIIEVKFEHCSESLMRGIVTAMQADWVDLGFPRPIPVSMKMAKERWSKCEEVRL